MFNKERIEALERRVRDLEDTLQQSDTWTFKRLGELREDLRTLARHSGVDFETEKSRKLVKL